MKKILMILAVLLMAFVLIGCGEQEATSEATEAATEAAPDAAEVVKTHDCEGACGMKDVPMDKLTEVHGKYYCAGCAKKANEDHGHDHG